MNIKMDLDVYDRMVMNMKMPKSTNQNTVKLTELPDNFEPTESSEFNDTREERIGNLIS